MGHDRLRPRAIEAGVSPRSHRRSSDTNEMTAGAPHGRVSVSGARWGRAEGRWSLSIRPGFHHHEAMEQTVDLITLRAAQNHPALRVLLLSLAESRLFILTDDLAPVRTNGFPVVVEAPHEEDTPHRDLPIHESAHDEARFVFRAVDHALSEADGNGLPIIVVGPERDLSLFAEVSHHRHDIVGTVHGNHLHRRPDELLDVIEPARRAYLATLRGQAIAKLAHAIDAQRAAVDPLEVWRAAQEGRGHLLLVDRTAELRGEMTGDHFEWVDADGADVPDAIPAIVMAVVEHGGEVVFTEPGELSGGTHLGLVLRY